MTSKHVHPGVFMVLIIPFGMQGGYLSTTLGYLLSKSGVSVDQIAGLVALALAPHTWKFLWAPIADTTISRKGWYVIAATLCAIATTLTGFLPTTKAGFAMISVVVFIASLSTTFLGMSVESFMAYGATETEKGRAGGWFQAGNLGGGGVGGGLGLWIAQHYTPWAAAAFLGLVCMLCCLGLFLVPEPHSAHRVGGFRQSLVEVGKDVWQVCRSRLGWLALVLCFLPVGSGAAAGLFAAVAGDWKASANAVALATGVLAGLAAALGCLLGGWVSDRMNRKGAYALYGVLLAACASAMAIAPRSETMYIVFTLIYSVISGLTYAGFSAFTLEAMGTGAAATKYSLFASLSNMPIWYMTLIDGWAHDRWGSTGMLHTEAVMGLIGLAVFGMILAIFPARHSITVPATQSPTGFEPAVSGDD